MVFRIPVAALPNSTLANASGGPRWLRNWVEGTTGTTAEKGNRLKALHLTAVARSSSRNLQSSQAKG